MTNSKSTKHTLLSSIAAIFVCAAMLIGTTFAWFTDTASTAVNKIQSGTLKVDIVNENDVSIKDQTIKFVNKQGSEDILWEPGVTFKTTGFKIKNIGKLALKYKLVLNGVTGSNKLLEVIKFSVVKADGTAVNLDTFEGNIKAGETDGETLYIQGEMDKTAGNDYQNQELQGIGIKVVATQYSEEFDSTRNDYDKDAVYPVATFSGLKSAFNDGGIVSVKDDIKTDGTDTASARTEINNPTTLNLEKKIISPDNMGNNNSNFVALFVNADTTINATAEGGIDTGINGGYGINVKNGASLTVNGGNYYGGGTAVQVQKGTLTINSGFFAVEPFGEPYGYKFLLNCIDSAYRDGTAKIIVKGGTFVNFNPADNAAEGAGTNFVANGYKVVSETKENGDVWYTVVAE